MRRQQGFGRDFDRLLHHVLGRVRDVADETQRVTRTDHFGAERGKPLMRNGPVLKSPMSLGVSVRGGRA
jgi:hypothetical protein